MTDKKNVNDMTADELKAELARLQGENVRLKTEPTKIGGGKLSTKVSEKGGLSLYGIGRFPATYYPQQWHKIIGTGETVDGKVDNGVIEEIRAAIKDGLAKGTLKDDPETIKKSKEEAAARTTAALDALKAKATATAAA